MTNYVKLTVRAVVLRLDDWLFDIGERIESSLDFNSTLRGQWAEGITLPMFRVAHYLTLGTGGVIDPLLPDLHYLSEGAGGVAALAARTTQFDAYIRAYVALEKGDGAHPGNIDPSVWTGLFDGVDAQLSEMRDIYSYTKAVLQPQINAAIDKGR
jgi:hypothetical protein